jgi:hypothetical protein
MMCDAILKYFFGYNDKYFKDHIGTKSPYVAHKNAPTLRPMSCPTLESNGFTKPLDDEETIRFKSLWDKQHAIWHDEYLHNIESNIFYNSSPSPWITYCKSYSGIKKYNYTSN